MVFVAFGALKFKSTSTIVMHAADSASNNENLYFTRMNISGSKRNGK